MGSVLPNRRHTSLLETGKHRKQVHISYSPLQPGVGTLSIFDGKKIQDYRVRELTVGKGYYEGRGFNLLKSTHSFERDHEEYNCFVATDPTKSTCECMGFLRHQHCKHLDALRQIVGTGDIAGVDDGRPAEPKTECGECAGTGVVADESEDEPRPVPCPECQRVCRGSKAGKAVAL